MSNSLGHITDIKKIILEAKKRKIPVIVDGCQTIAHLKIDVQDLDCDFYVFSGHKLYGPSGVGVLFGKEKRKAADVILSKKLFNKQWPASIVYKCKKKLIYIDKDALGTKARI